MAHQITFRGTVLTLPGSASFTDAERLATAGLAGAGVVGIVGEAEGGAGYDSDVIHLITRANAQAAKELFRSGPIFDAIALAFSPANDPAVPGGANAVLAAQVKKTVQSNLTMVDGAQDLIKLTSTLYGTPANLLSLTVVSVVVGAGTGRTFALQFDTADPIVSETIAVQDSGSDQDVNFKIQYTGDGTTGVMVLTDTALTTTLTGQTDGSVNLSLDFATYKTIQSLVDFVNVQTGYTATAIRSDADVFLMENVDHVGNTAPVDIKAAEVKLYSSTWDVFSFFNFTLANFVVPTVEATATEDEGQPDALTKTFFTGGSAGPALANSDWQGAFDLLKTTDAVEHVVPLLSADVGAVTIAAVNSQADQHAADMSNPGGNSERTAWCSITGTKATVKAEALRINSEHTTMAGQQLQMLDGEGNLVFFPEWGYGMVGACMRSGVAEEAEPITRKFVRASGVKQDSTWDVETDGAELLLAGLFMAQSVTAGIRVVKGVTTYTKKGNLALIDESQVTTWKAIQKRIRERLDALYVGTKGLVVTVQGVGQEIVAGLEEERSVRFTITDSILPDGTVQRAFTDPIVSFSGGTVIYSYGVKVVGGINFIVGTQTLEPVVITV